MTYLIYITLSLVALASFLFLYFNEKEDEVVRDRGINNPTRFIKTYSKLKKISLTSGANAKWFEPMEPYDGEYYPKWAEKPKYRERFKYSSTIWVFLTDQEHWFQWIKLRMVNLIVLVITIFIHVYFSYPWAYLFFMANQAGLFLMSFLKETIFKNLR